MRRRSTHRRGGSWRIAGEVVGPGISVVSATIGGGSGRCPTVNARATVKTEVSMRIVVIGCLTG